MSPFYFADVEMYSDRKEDLQALYAELVAEEDGADTDPSGGTGDELPPIIQDELPDYGFWVEAA